MFSSQAEQRAYWRTKSKEWYWKNHERAKATDRAYWIANAKPLREAMNARTEMLRKLAIEAYGGSEPRCACPGGCGETRLEFLSIDHATPEAPRMRHRSFYYWLRRENYPPGYRILCFNCNLAIGFRGKCPHEEKP